MKIILIIVIVIILYLLLLYGVFRVTFSTKGHKDYSPLSFPKGEQYEPLSLRMEELVNAALKVPYEEVYIDSFDGLKLYGRIYNGDPGRPVEIQFHGWRSNAVRDFAGGSAIGREAHNTVILVDERGINNSGGNMLTFGILERKDVLSWVQYANQRWNNPRIFLYGVSMGAATVLMAMDQNLPSNVTGIIADSPYTSPKAIICKVVQDMHLPVTAAWFLLLQASRLFGHFNINESDAAESVRKSDIPILLIHGNQDRFVPYEMSEEIKKAAGEKCTLEIFPGAPHGVSFLFDEERYRKVVNTFIDTHSYGINRIF